MPEAQPEESVETAVETTAPETDDTTPEENPEQPKKPAETVEFWRTKAREQEKRAKENAAAAKELADLKDAAKTETQRLLDRATSAEGALSAIQAAQEIRDAKEAVAKQYGIPADVLRGSDLEELEAHAQSLKALLPEPRKAGHVPAEGRTVTPGTGDPAQQFAELIRNARR